MTSLKNSASLLCLVTVFAAACGSSDATGGSGSSRAESSSKSKKSASAKPSASSQAAAPTATATATSTATAEALATTGCKEVEPKKRECTAVEFQKGWKASPTPEAYPSSATYKVSGKITKVQTSDKSKGESGDAWVYVQGDSKEVALKFDSAGKDVAAAGKLAVGSDVTVTCEFHGVEEIGTVTLEMCKL